MQISLQKEEELQQRMEQALHQWQNIQLSKAYRMWLEQCEDAALQKQVAMRAVPLHASLTPCEPHVPHQP